MEDLAKLYIKVSDILEQIEANEAAKYCDKNAEYDKATHRFDGHSCSGCKDGSIAYMPEVHRDIQSVDIIDKVLEEEWREYI